MSAAGFSPWRRLRRTIASRRRRDLRPGAFAPRRAYDVAGGFQPSGCGGSAERTPAHLGVSPGMIRQRVQRLNDRDVLQFAAVTIPLKIGNSTMALIGVKADGRRIDEISRQIAAFEEVIYLAITAGAYNFLVEVTCIDNAHLLRFLTDKLYSVEGVREAETFIYLDIVKEIYAWDPPRGEEEQTG